MKLFIHQERAVEAMHNGCCLTGEVGTGKSMTALAYWKKAEGARRVVVITTAKKRDSLDWQKDASYFLPIDLTVDSWNNIGKYEGVTDAFFIFDEQRIVGAGQWTKSFIKIARQNRWVLLSATPGDNWIDYIPLFVANGFYKNRTDFKREHVVYSAYSKFPKVERYIGVNKLMRHRKAILVEMPYISHTVRHPKDVEVDYDVELMNKVVKNRWHVGCHPRDELCSRCGRPRCIHGRRADCRTKPPGAVLHRAANRSRPSIPAPTLRQMTCRHAVRRVCEG